MAKPVNYPERARAVLRNHLELNTENPLPLSDIYVVWFNFTLGSWKALLSTTAEDNKYYEVTHNASKNQTYIDTYVKESNTVFGDDDNESKEQ